VALSQIEQAVMAKAEGEVASVLEDARREADELLERRMERARDDHTRRVEDARQELEAELDRETGAKETDDRLALLKIKNEIMDEIFGKALDSLRGLPDNGYAKWLTAQAKSLPALEGAALLGTAEDKALLQEVASEIGLTVSDAAVSIKGGFLVTGVQADLDVSVESLMAVLRESMTEEISTKLFSKGEA
jgi:vacuolar-type H+-ATPase subunit E/Vma4